MRKIRSTVLICLWVGVIGVIFGYIFLTTPFIPTYAEVRKGHSGSDLYLLDYKGDLLYQWRQNKNERSFAWVNLKDVSLAVSSAVLKSEDRNFYSHRGVDYPAVIASLYQRLMKNSSRGSSTISMQLAKLVVADKRVYQGFIGKLRQFWSASLLELKWDKQQILEAYLNLVPFRGEYRGLGGISWVFFNKKPMGLTLPEATLLAVLIRSPNAKPKEWAARACWQEVHLCNEFQSLSSELDKKTLAIFPDQHAIHLAQRLNRDGYKGEVVSSVRKDLQLHVTEIVQSQIRNLENQNVHDAAVLVLENETGEVWAYVGGAGLDSKTKYVDGVQAFRQAGSTLKPFLYATAFEKKLLTPESWIEDSAVDIIFDRGVYTPQNHDRQFYGWVQAKTALASSLNVPAVKVFKILNDESFWSKLHELHFRNLKNSDHYGPALALGVADINLEDLTQAYRTLARNGLYSPLRFVSPITAGSSSGFAGRQGFVQKILDNKNAETNANEVHRVFTEENAKKITQILSEGQNRALGFGLDSSLSLQGAAVKTGTSKDMRDNWCVGYNSKFTVGVWVGNYSGEPMWNVMGVTGAAPIWKKVMEYLQENHVEEIKLSDSKSIHRKNFARSSIVKTENFRSGQLDQESHEVTREQKYPEKYPQIRILYPQDGMMMALDPAIPVSNQKMPLLIEGPAKNNLFWKIDGKIIVSANKPRLWTPTLGRHRFELYKDKELAQSVQVFVK